MKDLKIWEKFILFGIFLLGLSFRVDNLSWDQGLHLHPDERAIIMTVTRLDYPQGISDFLSTQSPWNPHFFAYGSFPFYLLKIAGDLVKQIDPSLSSYDLIIYLGRAISSIFDMISLILIFYIGKRLFGKEIAFLTAFFYSIAVLPIQLSHFYAVDTILTAFSLAVLYRLIIFYEKPTMKNASLCGVLLGFAISTKISAIILLAPILIIFLTDILILILKHKKNLHNKSIIKHVPVFLNSLTGNSLALLFWTLFIFIICSPYALIDFLEFKRQTAEQAQMTGNAFVFPYTLQYVGKIPYFYELKNMILWGLGPIIGILGIFGTIYFLSSFTRKKWPVKWPQKSLLAVFMIFYFLIVGKFAIGFMRYMLPLYPLICLMAAVLGIKILHFLKKRIKNEFIINSLLMVFYFLLLIWPFSFHHIYTKLNTRVSATEWINKYIEPGKALALEHWDDPVPLSGANKYKILTLPMYDSESVDKWKNINNVLAQTDYIVIASNRLYTPLIKLTDCKSLPVGKCYRETAEYYGKLFDGSLGFEKIAQFTVLPTVPLLDIHIDDQSADESFTVYDHPKVMIFQKIKPSYYPGAKY